MKIVIFGLTISSSWGNGHATLRRGLCRAFGQTGHDVTFGRDLPYGDCSERPGCTLLRDPDWATIRGEAVRQLADSDVAGRERTLASYTSEHRAARSR